MPNAFGYATYPQRPAVKPADVGRALIRKAAVADATGTGGVRGDGTHYVGATRGLPSDATENRSDFDASLRVTGEARDFKAAEDRYRKLMAGR